MAFGDISLTVGILRIALPGVALVVGAPCTWFANRSQPNTWLTWCITALYGLAFATCVLGMAQMLVQGGHNWGGASVDDVLNAAACVGLILTAHSAWLLAAQIIDVTPWSSRSLVGRWHRYLTWGREDAPKKLLGALVAVSLAASLASILWNVAAGLEPNPDFKLTIYLSLPGFTALLLALMVTLSGGLEPLGPSLSFGVGPLLSLVAAVVEITEPPLPSNFDADALAVALLLVGLLGSWWGVHNFTVRKRRRYSMQESLLAGAVPPTGGNPLGRKGGGTVVKGTAARAELSAAFGRIRRSSLADLLWLNGPAPDAAPDPEVEWEAAAKRQKFAATLLWFVVCFTSGLPGIALSRFVQFDLRADPAMQEIFGVIGSVPWNFKFAAAFLSDTLPICGRRRIPYLVLGILAQCSAYWLIGVSGQGDPDDPWGWLRQSNGLYAALNMMMAVGAMFTGVMCDTVVVETSMRYERIDDKGQIQTNTWMWGGIGGLIAGLLAGWMIDPDLWPRFSNRQMLRFVALFRLCTLLCCFLLTDPKVHKAPGGFKKVDADGDGEGDRITDAGAATDISASKYQPADNPQSHEISAATMATAVVPGNTCLGKALGSGDGDLSGSDCADSKSGDEVDGEAQQEGGNVGLTPQDADAVLRTIGIKPFSAGGMQQGSSCDDPSSGNGSDGRLLPPATGDDGISEPTTEVVGFAEQCRQIWDAMHQDRIWRPMIFICIYALVPGNGGAFSSFTQGCPRDCTDENGELYPDFGFCERDEFGNLLDPDCREQPNPNWPGSGQYDGAGGTRGIEPMGFSSSLMAYVGTIGSIGSTFGIWIFKRYLMKAPWRPLFISTIILSTGLSLSQLILIYQVNQRWGIPNLVFALGDDLISVICGQFISMPIWVMMGQIVPKGTEASVFALVTSLQMVGGTAGGALTAVLTDAFGVTLQDYSSLADLVIITSCVKLVSLPFVALVPAHISLAREGTARSAFGAYLLGSTMVFGTSFAVFTALYKLVGGSFG